MACDISNLLGLWERMKHQKIQSLSIDLMREEKMFKRIFGLCIVSILLMSGAVQAQYTPWYYWTLIAQEHMN